MNPTLSLSDWAYSDFRSSGIPDRLTELNIRILQGEQAIAAILEDAIATTQKVTSYATTGAAKLLKKYEFIKPGCWASIGDNPIFKPFKPRSAAEGFGKGQTQKTIKYETRPGAIASPLLPIVDDETANLIYQRYGVQPLDGEGFWDTLARCNTPIAVTEGLKKSLALIDKGIPAIALRGVTCWHLKGSSELHDELKPFVTDEREIFIIFDQDAKLKTQANVRAQILKFGAVLESAGCKVRVPAWEPSQAKGIDDLLVVQDAPAEYLRDLLKNAPTLKRFKADTRKTAVVHVIRKLNSLSYPAERESEGEYIPELPPLQPGCIHVLLADMGSGKTYRITRDWIEQCRKEGIFIVILSPLNSLGKQTAQEAGLPHIHDFGTSKEQQIALWATARHQGGIVMCPNSLHRLPDSVLTGPICLGLDEANQTINHVLSGDTTSSNYQKITGLFADVLTQAISTGGVILAEAGIPDRAVKLVQEWTGVTDDKIRVFRHRKQSAPWDCTFYQGATSGFRAQILAAANSGKRLMIVTSSQREAAKLERALKAEGRKVVRIDGETNERNQFDGFFNNPDRWLKENQPDILIISPSGKSGLSIQGGVSAENAYFQQVWGYFPNLSTDSHLQLLGRFRPPVPRFIHLPAFILPSADESLGFKDEIKRRWQTNLQAMAALAGAETPQQTAHELAAIDYLAESASVSSLQKSAPIDALMDALEQAGHQVSLARVTSDKTTADLWDEIEEKLWREEAKAFATVEVDPETHTPEWAREYLSASETSQEGRVLAHKVIYRSQFPGILFDDENECYFALTKDQGKLARGVCRQVEAESPNAIKSADVDEINRNFLGSFRQLHKAPRRYVQALLLQRTGILDLLAPSSRYSNKDRRAIAIHEICLKYQSEIRYWLRLQVKPEHSPVETVNKLIHKLGLDAEIAYREGGRGNQLKIWQIVGLDDPLRQRLIEAARAKFDPGSLNLFMGKTTNKRVETTGQNPPFLRGGGAAIVSGQLETRGFQAGDIAIYSVDHLDKQSQKELSKLGHNPVGQTCKILSFETSGRIVSAIVQFGDGVTSRMPLSYLRPALEVVS